MYQIPTSTTKRRSGRPTQNESLELTAVILNAARQSFIERGFQDTTIQQLAADCGITRRSIASRFKSRDQLLIAVAEQEIETFKPRLQEMTIRETHCWEDLESICRRLWRRGFDSRESALLRAYLGETARLPELPVVIREFYYFMSEQLENLITQAQGFGLFRNFKASTVATCLVSLAVANPRIRTMLLDPRFDDEIESERYFTDIWTLIREMA